MLVALSCLATVAASCFSSATVELYAKRICVLPTKSEGEPCTMSLDTVGDATLTITLGDETHTLINDRSLFASGIHCFACNETFDYVWSKIEFGFNGDKLAVNSIRPVEILKKILVHGNETSYPTPKRHAYMQYIGSFLDGNVFDKTFPEEPFYHQVGSINIIKGMDIAVKTFSVGEKAKVVIPARLAYGNKGYAPLIGPDKDLMFEIEMQFVSDEPVRFLKNRLRPAARTKQAAEKKKSEL